MASTDGRPLRNCPYRATFALRDAAGQVVTAATSLDSEVSLDSGAFGDCTNEATEIGSSGIYYLDLTVAEMTAETIDVIVKSATANTAHISVRPEAALDSGVASASTSTSVTLASTASATDDTYNAAMVEIAAGTGRGQVRTITDYVGSTKVASVDRAWQTNPDTTSSYKVLPGIGIQHGTDVVAVVNANQIAANAAAATALAGLYKGGVILGSVNDGSATTTSFIGNSGLSSSDDTYNKQLIVFTTGTLAGEVEKISDYTGSTRTITLATALPSAPANGVEFAILSKAF